MLPRIHLNIEKWKLNKDLNIYVSSFGNFKTRDKKSIKMLTSSKTKYLSIKVNGKLYSAHRVVLSTFKPTEDKTLTVDHLDHNVKNNRLDNLEWCSIKENHKRAVNDNVEHIAKTTKIEYSPEIKMVIEAQRANAPKGKYICFGSHQVKTCSMAAKTILKERELPCSDKDVQHVASRIGEIINTNKTYYGYKFERRMLK